MKKTILLVLVCVFQFTVNAQFTVSINGKKITANQEFNFADIKSLSINFNNPQKLPAYADGDLSFYCSIKDKEGKVLKYLAKVYSGYTPVSVALTAKTPKEYILMPSTKEADFIERGNGGNGANQFSQVCEELKSNPKAEKVTVEFSLIFNENLGRNSFNGTKYGQNVELMDRLSFTLNIADKNAMINCTSINAKFILSDLTKIGYEKLDSLNTSSELQKISDSFKKPPEYTTFYFEGFWFRVYNFKYENNISQDENLNSLKVLADKNASLYSNECNPEPIKWKGTDNTEKNKIFDSKINYLFNISGDKIVEKFDRKNNKNSENETLWTNCTLSGLNGFKSINILKNNPCRKDKFLGATMSARPEDRIIKGSSAVYAFKNPNSSKSILVFTWFSSLETETQESTNIMASKLEKFISLLKF